MSTAVISFESLVPGSAGVRVTNDVPAKIWAIELVMAVTGKSRDYAGQILRKLKVEVFDPAKLTETHLAANGGLKTKLLILEHALELVMVLPGKMISNTLRLQVCDILKRFFADTPTTATADAMAMPVNMPIAGTADTAMAGDKLQTPVDMPIVGTAVADDTAMADDVDEVTRGMKTISFESLVSGSAGVRVTDDVPPKIWAVELVMAVTGKNRNAANEVLRDIDTDIFDTAKFVVKILPGNGKWPVKLVTFEHALELVMVLPGTAAKAFRVQACDILKRFFAGDQTLHAQIDQNATSTAPINVFARAAVAPGGAESVAKRVCLAQSQDAHDARNERNYTHICNAYEKYMEIQNNVKDPVARASFSDGLVSNMQNFIAQPTGEKPQPAYKYVYCLQSKGQPDVVKIGYTGNVKERISKINYQRMRDGLDDPMIYRYSVRTLYPERDEKHAHIEFAAFRLTKKEELFRTTPESVRDYFNKVLKPRYLIESGTKDYEVMLQVDPDVSDADVDMEVA